MYATKIIEPTFEKTKKLFFPIRKGYWIRMAIINLFGSTGGGGYSGSGSGGGDNYDLPATDLRAALADFNAKALDFLGQYGWLVAILFFGFYLVGLLFTYLNSVFMFMFMQGLDKGDIRIRKSFGENQHTGMSLFSLRFVVGIFSMLIVGLIFSPLLAAFFSGELASFNYWLLIPMFLILILYALVMGLFWFLVIDFVVPIMYFKKLAFMPAWRHFLKVAGKNKMEIFVYWLLKIALSIAVGLISFIIAIPYVLLFFIAVGIVVGIYFLFQAFLGTMAALLISIPLGIAAFILLFFLGLVVFVPFPAFMRMYALEMVKKLDPSLAA